ncbi:MAG: sulfate/thiosulfate transport system substrate-binding protein, partial [Actinomycetota bacterium]|nr:sulfate/thiosulfate transport system substrate-binding protein [Actinomycetota bacterium]
MKRARALPVVALLLFAAVLSACGSDTPTTTASTANGPALPAAELALVAYSTPQAAYDQITDAFAKTPQGRNITFTKSFGASGEQSRAVDSGLAADYVAFSLEPDMTRLVKKDPPIVAADWNANQYKGKVTESVVVLIVRKGNPKNIKTWEDLTKPGIVVVNPNPFTSGGARWNVMAAYGQAAKAGGGGAPGGNEAAGVDYLNRLYKNVVVQDDSA